MSQDTGRRHIIVVAGGTGLRMGADKPKQFLEINDVPILMRTLYAFYNFQPSLSLILVLPSSHLRTWEDLCIKHGFEIKHKVVAGGSTRFQSVKNGLNAIKDEVGIVAVHDGVRPFVSKKMLMRLFLEASTKGNAIPTLSLKDSLRKVESGESHAVNRADFCLVQTPQIFEINLLRRAYEQAELEQTTDDAGLVERLNERIYLVEGSPLNIKITTPEDLLVASAFSLSGQQKRAT